MLGQLGWPDYRKSKARYRLHKAFARLGVGGQWPPAKPEMEDPSRLVVRVACSASDMTRLAATLMHPSWAQVCASVVVDAGSELGMMQKGAGLTLVVVAAPWGFPMTHDASKRTTLQLEACRQGPSVECPHPVCRDPACQVQCAKRCAAGQLHQGYTAMERDLTRAVRIVRLVTVTLQNATPELERSHVPTSALECANGDDPSHGPILCQWRMLRVC
mmetsp:Transcript_10443/g.23649  ORF Transcript_10443/g.23649 Transcript_10443/m.23649 type:complete len:217 (+) Transcript_10443:1450-2100(+)